MDIKDNLRVGFGYDSHRFSEERKLFLCGIEIENQKGLLGHSDGDVCLHSIIDALFSGTNLGDIGENFPEIEKYKDISSKILVKETLKKIYEKYPSFEIINLSLTIITEFPKIKPIKEKLQESLSNLFKIQRDKISISAKTQEGMGFVGRGEGMASICIVLIKI